MNYTNNELEALQDMQLKEGESHPKLLFKFKQFETALQLARLCDGIKENYLYYPTIDQLNDSLEGRGTHIFYEGEKESHESTSADKYRVLSLSANCFSPVMWSHYGNNRTGICLGFFKGNPYDNLNNGSFRDAEKIDYLEKVNLFSVDEESAIHHDLTHKSIDWEYEKEWRFTREPNHLGEELKESDKRFYYKRSDLACVIFGEKIHEDIQKHIMQFLDNVPIFFYAHDAEKYTYYLTPHDKTNSTKIYTVDELYQYIERAYN